MEEKTENLYKMEIDIESYLKKIPKSDSEFKNNFENLLKEIKSYIFDNPFLREKFIQNVKDFDKYSKTEEYKSFKKSIYEHLKKFGVCRCLFKNNEFNPLIPPKELLININGEECAYIKPYDYVCFGVMNYYRNCLEIMKIFEQMGVRKELKIREILHNQTRAIDYFILSELNPKIIYLKYYNDFDKNYFINALAGMLSDLRQSIQNEQIKYYTKDEKQIEEIQSARKDNDENLLLHNKIIDFERYTELKIFNKTQRSIINLIVNRYQPKEMPKMLFLGSTTIYNNINAISKELHDMGIKKTKKGGYREILKFFESNPRYYMQKKSKNFTKSK